MSVATRARELWNRVDFDSPRTRAALALTIVAITAVALVALFVLPGDSKRTASPAPDGLPSSSSGPGTSSTHAPVSKKPFACKKAKASTFGGSAPVRICLPDIKVDSDLMELGLNGDRTVQVPPLSKVREAGWYKHSATPGSKGSTVILGHVDSAQYGDGVFYRLDRLHPSDRVLIARGDGKIATYRIDRVATISKKKFPTQAVYGPSSHAVIRLVTCGGTFNQSTGSYEDNVIAYGTLTSLKRG